MQIYSTRWYIMNAETAAGDFVIEDIGPQQLVIVDRIIASDSGADMTFRVKMGSRYVTDTRGIPLNGTIDISDLELRGAPGENPIIELSVVLSHVTSMMVRYAVISPEATR